MRISLLVIGRPRHAGLADAIRDYETRAARYWPLDVVEVKDGYGRNYLLPRGLATAWTKGGEKQVAQIQRARAVREVKDLDSAKAIKDELEWIRAGTKGRQTKSKARIKAFDQLVESSEKRIINKAKSESTTTIRAANSGEPPASFRASSGFDE